MSTSSLPNSATAFSKIDLTSDSGVTLRDTTKLGTLRAFTDSSSFPILQPTSTIPLAPAVARPKQYSGVQLRLAARFVWLAGKYIDTKHTYPRPPPAPVITTTFPIALRLGLLRLMVSYVAAYALGELEGFRKHIWVNRGVRHLGRYLVKVMRQVVYEQCRSLKLHLKISTRLHSTKDFQYPGGHFQCFEISKMLADNCSLSFARCLGCPSAKIRLWRYFERSEPSASA